VRFERGAHVSSWTSNRRRGDQHRTALQIILTFQNDRRFPVPSTISETPATKSIMPYHAGDEVRALRVPETSHGSMPLGTCGLGPV